MRRARVPLLVGGGLAIHRGPQGSRASHRPCRANVRILLICWADRVRYKFGHRAGLGAWGVAARPSGLPVPTPLTRLTPGRGTNPMWRVRSPTSLASRENASGGRRVRHAGRPAEARVGRERRAFPLCRGGRPWSRDGGDCRIAEAGKPGSERGAARRSGDRDLFAHRVAPGIRGSAPVVPPCAAPAAWGRRGSAERTHGGAPEGAGMFPGVPECSTAGAVRERTPARNEANVGGGWR